ncbi:MlaC/ttg2D family ABC transporter substrate-binding protein [Glacieibacterium sp.]|uniref:MlaC/ttg2D family ABC transporter substrate-binding protein n=1 Tax=Glacieibacterium sp. TaxID=2860237 RepID=UPI003B00343C
MRKYWIIPAVVLLGTVTTSGVIAPAVAQVASATDAQGASKFVDELSKRVFDVLKDQSVSKAQNKNKLRAMLRENFALQEIGDRLIRRYRSQITPAQYAAYQAALPEFTVNAYGDRLYNYANADVQPVRTVPRGTKGDVDVYTKIVRPGGAQPFDAIWTIRRVGGKFLITNLTVAGINLSLTQEADFSSYISKNGFDALVTFMKSSNAKAAI